jgi:hypothetical protein
VPEYRERGKKTKRQWKRQTLTPALSRVRERG